MRSLTQFLSDQQTKQNLQTQGIWRIWDIRGTPFQKTPWKSTNNSVQQRIHRSLCFDRKKELSYAYNKKELFSNATMYILFIVRPRRLCYPSDWQWKGFMLLPSFHVAAWFLRFINALLQNLWFRTSKLGRYAHINFVFCTHSYQPTFHVLRRLFRHHHARN